jgi:hypothetical protein
MKLGALLALLILIAVSFAADTPTVPGAVNAVRALNTAEMRYFKAHSKYATAEELSASPELKQMQASRIWPKAMTASAQPLPDYKLRILTSADGKSYQLSLIRDASPKTALFSDENGIIYQAEPIR